MHIHIAVAKTPKFGHGESGDTTDVVERPGGGLSAVLADGQGHGRAAKRLSTMVVAKAVTLLGDGARDGAVARAVHDHLYMVREGKVSSDLVLLSADLRTRTLVVARNCNTPVLVLHPDRRLTWLDEPATPIGVHLHTRPLIAELPLAPGLVAVAFSDGVHLAGARAGRRLTVAAMEEKVLAAGPGGARELADALLAAAMAADDGRPGDDMAVLVLALDGQQGDVLIRRLYVSVPY